MDPFTALGAVGATASLIYNGVKYQSLMRTIRTLKDALDKILALNNNLASLAVILERVKDAHTSMCQANGPQPVPNLTTSLDGQLRRAIAALRELTNYSAQLAAP